MIEVRNYINGRWVRSSGESFQSYNPSTGKPLSTAPATTASEVAEAVAAAKAAFHAPAWRGLSAGQRATALLALADALQKRRKEAATSSRSRWASRSASA